jgi:hypothetical protein
MSPQGPVPGEIYLEFQSVGKQVRVTAIDAGTGTEVVVFGPHTASQSDLKNLAVRKLQKRLAREEPEVLTVERGRLA